jgi:hypothetical protein
VLIQIFTFLLYLLELIRNTFIVSQMDDFLFFFFEDHNLRWRVSYINDVLDYTKIDKREVEQLLSIFKKKTGGAVKKR